MSAQRRDQPAANPFASAVPLGRWAGVPVAAHWSVLIAVALFTVMLGSAVLPDAAPGRSGVGYWLSAAVTAVVFMATLLAHELAHAVAARHYGMPVKRITLWMLGGLTELDGEPPSPRADAVIAGSGPATSLLIGGLLTGAVLLVDSSSLAVVAAAWLAIVNLLLAVFNLLPGAPLDGGRLLRAFVWWRRGDRRRADDTSTRAGRALGTGLIALGLLETLLGLYGGLWLALVGWFIVNSATGESYARAAEGLSGVKVRDIMEPDPAAVPAWWTVEQFLERLDMAHMRQPAYPLVDFDGHATGVLAPRDFQRLSDADRTNLRLREVRHPARLLLVREDVEVRDLIPALPTHGGVGVVVDDESRPVGVVTAGDVARASRLAELGWMPPAHPSGTAPGSLEKR